MNGKQQQGERLWTTLAFGGGAILLAIGIVNSPGPAFEASLQGLTLWWRVVFPGLLPFLVVSQILVAYGFVHALGVILDPLLRKGLGVPGVAGWIIPLGLIAGFPAAAEASVQLHNQGKLTARQAERLAAAGHFCSPMLIIVVIGAGFLHTPALGLLLAAVHVAAGLAAGLTLHFLLIRKKKGYPLSESDRPPLQSAPRRIAASIEEARHLDGRSFGRLLGETVASAVQTLMMVGGYMMIFAVVIRMLQLYIPGLNSGLGLPGLMEVHLGANAAANTALPSAALQAAVIGAILGLSGLSGYLQVRAILSPAGIRSRSFLLTRVLHASYAYVLTLLCWKPLLSLFPDAAPVYTEMGPGRLPSDPAIQIPSWSNVLSVMEWQAAALFLLIISLMIFTVIWRFRQRVAR